MNWQALNDNATQIQTSLPLSTNTLIPLPQLAVIAVKGEEASGFLQNLLTNDVKQLHDAQAQLTGLCNPKGRLLAVLQLFQRNEQDFLLILPQDLANLISQRLTMFKLRSKVSIEISDELCVAGWLNPHTSLPLPTETRTALMHDQLAIIRQAGETVRYLLIAAESDLNAFMSDLDETHPANYASWQLQEIQAGIPAVFADTVESFTPQQVNLDLIGGVSFKKGCYPGQEVVARLHYLGTPSRRMFLATLDTNHTPASGGVVMDNQQTVQGHVVQAQTANDECLCLLSLKLAAADDELMIDSVAVKALTPLAQD